MGIFDKIFKTDKKLIDNHVAQTQFKLMNDFIPIFNEIVDPYESATARKAIHTIATHAAKLNGRHIRQTSDDKIEHNDNLTYLLGVRPNTFMSAFDMQYKVVTTLLLRNNAFIYIDRNKEGKIIGFHPVNNKNFEMMEYQGELYIKFEFPNGNKFTAHYDDFIHLRRYFNDHDLLGSSNKPIQNKIQVIQTSDDSVVNAVKQSSFLRGILKYNTMLKEEDVKKHRDTFIREYMDIEDQSGVAALDAKADYKELSNEPKMTNEAQMKFFEEDMLSYFNLNTSIVNSDYTEDQWNAFYESVLEPIALQMSQEFTNKVFTRNEQNYGNEILFDSNRIQYASVRTKIALVQYISPLGALRLNEVREMFNLPPIEGGDKILQSLNYVDATKAEQYQNVDKNEKDDIKDMNDDIDNPGGDLNDDKGKG
ncbi:phage portal protein [Salinicoccus carnicancri]|uniref:phage portal protein n=1 Tax=Salinicoccus carnicancri TaxID=558170 RepID=UPI00031CD465|nr:phage portal protein [Salinicoccus carnicancri]